jgi:hypothetical protein
MAERYDDPQARKALMATRRKGRRGRREDGRPGKKIFGGMTVVLRKTEAVWAG